MKFALQVENTIRWRSVKDEDGNEVKESNARVVKWSDGTMSLLLGGEVFDIHKTKIDGEHNHLFVQQVYHFVTALTAQTIFINITTHMSFYVVGMMPFYEVQT